MLSAYKDSHECRRTRRKRTSSILTIMLTSAAGPVTSAMPARGRPPVPCHSRNLYSCATCMQACMRHLNESRRATQLSTCTRCSATGICCFRKTLHGRTEGWSEEPQAFVTCAYQVGAVGRGSCHAETRHQHAQDAQAPEARDHHLRHLIEQARTPSWLADGLYAFSMLYTILYSGYT